MCGIVGWIRRDDRVDGSLLATMRDAMAHRGPDGQGSWLDDDGRVGFGHRRLSIIDLDESANQPMVDMDRRAVIVFNGEIYNHRELRERLKKKGAKFKTDHSDTECILLGYLHWGIEELLEQLIGMFAFSIYDVSEKKVHVVRDRVGIKPLYYRESAGDFLFASETKALLKHPAVSPKLNKSALWQHLSFRAVPTPETLFEGISSLGAGERLCIDTVSLRVEKHVWWDPLAVTVEVPKTIQAAEDRLYELLESSINYRLESDVPLGLFLSGGLDSGYLLRSMAERVENLESYTVQYPGFDKYNEHELAKDQVAQTNAVYNDVPLTASDFANDLPLVAYYQDEPVAAPVCAAVYRLAAAAQRGGRKVILAGEGSDELFIGYDTWLKLRDAARRLRIVPAPLVSLAFFAARIFKPASRYTEMLGRASSGQPLFWGGSMDFTDRAKRSLVSSKARVDLDTYDASIAPIRKAFLKNRPENDHTAWMTYVDLKFRLPQLMLPRLDKMGMAHSIEGRVPFLDHRLIEFFLHLPSSWRGDTSKVGKMLFKKVAERRLSHDFIYRKKQGFQAPVIEWQQAILGSTYVPLLERFCRRTELFNTDFVRQLISRPNRLYFSLVNFMLWYCLFVENVLEDDIPESLAKVLSDVGSG